MSRGCIQCNMPIHHAETCQHYYGSLNHMVQEWQTSPLCLGKPVMRPTLVEQVVEATVNTGFEAYDMKAEAGNAREAFEWLQQECLRKGYERAARHAEILSTLNDDDVLASFVAILTAKE